MLRLMLLRHAKSARPAGIGDHERPLAARGRAASPWIGSYMAAQGPVPDLALVSTARRTGETWQLARPAFDKTIRHREEPRLYEASADAMLGIVREVDGEAGTLLLVGHNPGLQDFALRLIGQGEERDLAQLRRKLPTAALVVIEFAAERWSEVSPGTGRLERFVVPPPLDAE